MTTIKSKASKQKYVMVRTYAMGVFVGYLDPKSTKTLKILHKARRIWYWSGAASLSQLAQSGTTRPSECKFPEEVDTIELSSPQGFEILSVTDAAKQSIASVPIWKK